MGRRLIIFLLLQFFLFNLQAQDPVQQIWDQVEFEDVSEEVDSGMDLVSPWSFSTSVGTSFGFSPYFGSAMNMYAAPQARYSVTDRLTFHGGIIASQMLPTMRTGNSEFPTSSSYTNLSAFVAASYMLTNDLLVYGTVVKSMMNPGLNGQNANFAMDDFSIGAAYSFGNFTIGASFHSGNTNPYRSSPFNTGRGMYGSPFYW